MCLSPRSDLGTAEAIGRVEAILQTRGILKPKEVRVGAADLPPSRADGPARVRATLRWAGERLFARPLSAAQEGCSASTGAETGECAIVVNALGERRTGTSYPPAFDVLTRVFETRVDRILGGGNGDPAYVAAQQSRRIRIQLSVALADVYRADPRGRGGEYVAEVARSATAPAVECRPVALYIRPPGTPDPDADKPWCPADSLWCDAWGILMTRDRATGRPTGRLRRVAVDGAPDPERYRRLCNWKH